MQDAPLRVFMVAGEESGDQLGGALVLALRRRRSLAVSGVGGAAMLAAGLAPLFPMEEIAVMGFAPVARRLPLLLRRIRDTAEAVVAAKPDVLVLIDAPDFTHRVARAVRARAPAIPIVDYVSPTVWAWRPGRARRMAAYVDHLMALLPFEPEAHLRLGGPPTTYVGHPLTERLAELTPTPADSAARRGGPPSVLILPGSRRAEVRRLLRPFGEAVAQIAQARPETTFVLPAVAHVRADIEAAIQGWPVRPRVVSGDVDKFEAFRRASAAIAASGTVTLELALAGVPTVVGYKVSRVEEMIARRLLSVSTIVLPNLILGERVFPEFLQRECRGETLASVVLALLQDGPERAGQVAAMVGVAARVAGNGVAPSDAAAEIVLRAADQRR